MSNSPSICLSNNASILEISSAHLIHNLKFFSQQLKNETKIMAVVKASAYGNGATAIAQLIEKEGLAAYFAVAQTQEGIQLKQAGVKLPIVILNPRTEEFSLILKYNLEVEINHLAQLQSLEKVLSKELSIPSCSIHLKFNTGMNRLGFEKADLTDLITILKDEKKWRVKSIMTHLSASNLRTEDAYTLNQFKCFDAIWEELKAYLPSDCMRHALNSNGIVRFPEFQYDMVRLGIGMYGGSSVKEILKQTKEIGVFKSKILQTRRVSKGATMSYSRSGKVSKETHIATVAVGYADGFSRILGNGNWEVEINGKLYPTIGDICMDLTLVDLGEDAYKDGEEVILFGGKKSIHQYAKAMNTITYEAMCRIGTRVKRILI